MRISQTIFVATALLSTVHICAAQTTASTPAGSAAATGTTFKLDGGSNQVFSGAVYVPKGATDYAGGASSTYTCTQLISDTITFTGSSNFAINCGSQGTKPIGSMTAQLVE